jgi:hypothetical protein
MDPMVAGTRGDHAKSWRTTRVEEMVVMVTGHAGCPNDWETLNEERKYQTYGLEPICKGRLNQLDLEVGA